MPELPDVEVFRRYLESTSLHQTVAEVRVYDERVLEDVTPESLGEAVTGRSFISTRRHGKNLFVGLEPDRWLHLHFGMTGFLRYFKDKVDAADSYDGEPQGAPEHTRVLFVFAGDYRLAFVDQRVLGKVGLTSRPEHVLDRIGLGPDALEISREEFRERIASQRGMIKSALMNQSVVAGIGNIYSDEILFQAGIHPRRAPGELGADDIDGLFGSMKYVLEAAVDAQADPARFPASWLLAHRWLGEGCPQCGGSVEKVRISGRAGYFCPACQK